MYCYQPLVLIFQIFKIFEQRTLTPSKFDSWSRPCKHAIDGEKLTCMHHRFGMKLNQRNIWLAISGQSNCIDHKITCKACLEWESEGPFFNLVANCNVITSPFFVCKITINAGLCFQN